MICKLNFKNALFIFLISFITPNQAVASQQDDSLLRAADNLFNNKEYSSAREEYFYLLDIAKGNKNKNLEGELLNNIAATYIASDEYSSFRQYFNIAKAVKLSQAARLNKVKQRSGPNLLINGGFEGGVNYPWGTGHYERKAGKFGFGLWWNSNKARAFMKLDRDIFYSGKGSLRVTNLSPAKAHTFSTLSQRIKGLRPNTVYRISFYAKTQDIKKGAVNFAIDAAWAKRLLRIKEGTQDWTFYSGDINIGHNDYIDFRIIHENTGTVWLDEITVSEINENEDNDLLQQAESLFDQADYVKALKLYKQIEASYLSSNDKPPVLVKLMQARIYKAQGEYSRALDGLSLLVEKKVSASLIDIGDLYNLLGDYARAENYFNKALLAYKGDQGAYALILNKLAENYLAKDELDEALKAQKKSYRILAHIDNKLGQGLSLHSLGIIYTRLEKYSQAYEKFVSAKLLIEELDDKKLLSDILNSHAFSLYQQGELESAAEYISRAMLIKREISDLSGLIKSLHLQGRILKGSGKNISSVNAYREAVSLLQTLLDGLGAVSRKTKNTYLGKFSDLYREYIELLFGLHNEFKGDQYGKEAFLAVEQVRSRTFTEMISEARAARVFKDSIKDEELAILIKSERRVLLKMESIYRARESNYDVSDAAKKSALDLKLNKAEKQYRLIQAELAEKFPRYLDLKKPKPLEISALQKLLDHDDVILSYFVTSEHLGIWAIDKNDMKLVVSNLGSMQLRKNTRRIRAMATRIVAVLAGQQGQLNKRVINKAFGYYNTSEAKQLYDDLVQPHESLLKNKKILYIVPDDVLYKVPFEALLTDDFTGQDSNVIAGSFRSAPFLIKKHEVVYLPSLSVLRTLQTFTKKKKSTQEKLIAFADPVFNESTDDNDADNYRVGIISQLTRGGVIEKNNLPRLPETREEALFVADLLDVSSENVYLGTSASETNVKSLPLNKFSNVLFATHGFLAGEFKSGVQPALALSFVGDAENDGLLEMSEILGLNLNANLVVLSACNTASGVDTLDQGEGFAGLTRSFMYAGSRSLFVTLWSVESSTAQSLIQSSFKLMSKLGKSGSLADAKRTMIGSSDTLALTDDISVSTAHPYFWAPYVLVGEAHSEN